MARNRDQFSPAQSRAARALLDWTIERAAKAAGLEEEALELFEAGEAPLGAYDNGRLGMMFNAAGVIAVQSVMAGIGVRFRASTAPDIAGP